MRQSGGGERDHDQYQHFFFFLTLEPRVESYKKVHEPEIQALLGTASHFCKVAVRFEARQHLEIERKKVKGLEREREREEGAFTGDQSPEMRGLLKLALASLQ